MVSLVARGAPGRHRSGHVIHHIEGVLEEKPPGRVVVEVAGVGFEIYVSEAAWHEAGIRGGRVRVLTHLVVREDQWLLFGFRNEDERILFRLLIEVQGVGPKLALAAISGLTADRLRGVIGEGDVATLCTVSGIGKKTAQRIVVDLKDKLAPSAAQILAAASMNVASEGDDAVDALVTLGYSRHLAREAVRGTRAAHADLALDEVVRDALRRL
jgi:Holliday junction DNA helicase RuvA